MVFEVLHTYSNRNFEPIISSTIPRNTIGYPIAVSREHSKRPKGKSEALTTMLLENAAWPEYSGSMTLFYRLAPCGLERLLYLSEDLAGSPTFKNALQVAVVYYACHLILSGLSIVQPYISYLTPYTAVTGSFSNHLDALDLEKVERMLARARSWCNTKADRLQDGFNRFGVGFLRYLFTSIAISLTSLAPISWSLERLIYAAGDYHVRAAVRVISEATPSMSPMQICMYFAIVEIGAAIIHNKVKWHRAIALAGLWGILLLQSAYDRGPCSCSYH